jgi:hypothetical protein
MTIFLLVLGGLAALGIVASIVVVSRDGYRREPVRSAEVPQNAPAGPDTRPSDIISSQWMQDRSRPAVRGRGPAKHAAGAMALRPW